MENNKSKSVRLKMGTFSTIAIIFAVAIAIVVNLVFQNLDIYFDLTPDRLYSISDKSKEVLSGIEENVKIYTLYKTGEEPSIFTQYLEDYKLYPNISIENIDPYVNINFTEKYAAEGETIPIGSIIVTSGDRHKVITSSQMFTSTYDYLSMQEVVESITLEYELTNAIRYVAGDADSKIYFITGHNEVGISQMFLKALEDSSFSIENFQLNAANAIPGDASAIFITTPLRDYTDFEAELVMEYLENGGKAVFFIDYTGVEYLNLKKIVNYYGVDFVENAVLEGDPAFLMPLQNAYQNPFAILPIYGKHSITSPLEGSDYKVMVSNARPLYKTQVSRRDLTIDAFLLTSPASYLKNLETYTTFNKEAGDEEGPFAIAYAVTDESVSISKPTKIALAGTSAFLADEFNNGANANLVANIFNWACDRMPNVYIEPRMITSSMLNLTSRDEIYRLGAISVIGVPAVIFITGAVVWLRRRNK